MQKHYSRHPVGRAQLKSLVELARVEEKAFFERNPHLVRPYRSRLLAIALCQGAALWRIGRGEARLSAAFTDFRAGVRTAIASALQNEQIAGAFAVEILGKRLLSCPFAFADSWRRVLEGIGASDVAAASDVRVSERAVREETGDDREQESRAAHAARVIGAWLKPLAGSLQGEIAVLSSAVADLGLAELATAPREDARYEALRQLIRQRLQAPDGSWLADERLVVFTEFKTTLDYLAGRLGRDFPGEGLILQLFGTGEMDQRTRDSVISAFNDPRAPVRILVATDAASEGLNLQHSTRYLLHFDVPWNPARLEQRNGRIDRYGQARDVTIFHFASDDDAHRHGLHPVRQRHNLSSSSPQQARFPGPCRRVRADRAPPCQDSRCHAAPARVRERQCLRRRSHEPDGRLWPG